MPRNLKRYYFGAGHLHFITSSCYHREPHLGSPRRRDLFLKVLERMRRRYSFVVLGYVVMRPSDNDLYVMSIRHQRRVPSAEAESTGTWLKCMRRQGPTSRKTGEKWGTPFG